MKLTTTKLALIKMIMMRRKEMMRKVMIRKEMRKKEMLRKRNILRTVNVTVKRTRWITNRRAEDYHQEGSIVEDNQEGRGKDHQEGRGEDHQEGRGEDHQEGRGKDHQEETVDNDADVGKLPLPKKRKHGNQVAKKLMRVQRQRMADKTSTKVTQSMRKRHKCTNQRRGGSQKPEPEAPRGGKFMHRVYILSPHTVDMQYAVNVTMTVGMDTSRSDSSYYRLSEAQSFIYI